MVLASATIRNPSRVAEIFANCQEAVSVQRSTKIRCPEFDGNPMNLRTFIAQLRNKLCVNRDHFSNEREMVGYSYQCLSPSAAQCMRAHFRNLEDPTMSPDITTVEDFISKLKYYFQNPGLVERSDRELTYMEEI